MTKEELMALLRDPDQTGQAVDELNRLIGENPYFHTGHQLQLQSLKKTDEEQMALQLGKTALNVRDRGLLYNYINRPSAFRKQATGPEDDVLEVIAPFAPGSAFASPDVDIHNMQQTQASATVLEPKSTGMEGLRGETHTDGVFPAEEKIMSNAELMEIIQRQLNRIDKTEPQEEDNKTTEVATGKLRLEYTEEQLIADLMNMPLDDVAVVEEPKEITNNDLIDSFIKANPKIIPLDTVYEVDLTNSLQEDQDMVTEILADIYISQGHFKKAIEIYEHLSLKYPEKGIYFAAQIKRLNEEHN